MTQRVLKVLKLFCENHYLLLQDYIRDQHNTSRTSNILESIGKLIKTVSSNPSKRLYPVLSQAFITLTELIQGPCVGNQNQMIQSDFISVVNNIFLMPVRLYVTESQK